MFSGTGAELTSYFFNGLIQMYSMCSSYYFFITILPTILRFRTVYDYRIAHELACRKDSAEKHSYFQGFVTVSLQSFFSTVLISILVCEPAPILMSSTPLFITWCVFTLLWVLPIKMILFLSLYFRWVSALAGIIFECIFVLNSIERGISASYKFRTGGVTSSYFDTLTSEPALIAGITTVSVPMSLLCGFLAVQGNAMLSDFVNLMGDYRVRTPPQLKNPMLGANKIGTWLVVLFVGFVVTFVPAEMYSKGYPKNSALLLPTITLENTIPPIPTSEIPQPPSGDVKLCIKQQQRNKQLCYHDLLLGWCYRPQHKPTELFSAESPTFAILDEVYNEMMCNLALTAIHITGTKPCMNEDGLQPITLQLKDDHEKHPRISSRVLSIFHKRTTKYTANEIFPLSKVPSMGPTTVQSAPRIAPTYAYATTPIEQVGQPVLARMIRNTWSTIITQPLQYIISVATHYLGNILYHATALFLDIIPHELTHHLQTQNHYEECMYTNQLSAPVPTGSAGLLKPSNEYQNLAKRTIPSDTLFFIHIPITHDVTTIIPLTFSLFKSIFLATWFCFYFWYFLPTRFQSPAALELRQIYVAEDKLQPASSPSKPSTATTQAQQPRPKDLHQPSVSIQPETASKQATTPPSATKSPSNPAIAAKAR